MSADCFSEETGQRAGAEAPGGLAGVDDLVRSRGLEVLREHVDLSGLTALVEIARIVAAHDAGRSEAA